MGISRHIARRKKPTGEVIEYPGYVARICLHGEEIYIGRSSTKEGAETLVNEYKQRRGVQERQPKYVHRYRKLYRRKDGTLNECIIWIAQVRENGKQKYLGSRKNKSDAIKLVTEYYDKTNDTL